MRKIVGNKKPINRLSAVSVNDKKPINRLSIGKVLNKKSQLHLIAGHCQYVAHN